MRRALTMGICLAALVAGTGASHADTAYADTAHADTYIFKGNLGTVCSVEVGARASDSLGGLSGPPQVGYSATPTCEYPTPGERKAALKRVKRCRAKAGGSSGSRKRAKAKRCKRKRKRHRHRLGGSRSAAVPPRTPLAEPAVAAPAAPVPPALLDSARLVLLTPAGVADTGDATAAAGGLGGYSCSLDAAGTCADSGRLVPAVPGAQYFASFSLELAPPAGESWIAEPGGCSGPGAAVCELRSGTVSPRI